MPEKRSSKSGPTAGENSISQQQGRTRAEEQKSISQQQGRNTCKRMTRAKPTAGKKRAKPTAGMKRTRSGRVTRQEGCPRQGHNRNPSTDEAHRIRRGQRPLLRRSSRTLQRRPWSFRMRTEAEIRVHERTAAEVKARSKQCSTRMR